MLTEEAKTKQCRIFPFMAQIWGPVEGTTNIEHIPSKCCADECMHWCWCIEEIPKEEQDGINPFSLLGIPPIRHSSTHGYCGLSGKVGAE